MPRSFPIVRLLSVVGLQPALLAAACGCPPGGGETDTAATTTTTTAGTDTTGETSETSTTVFTTTGETTEGTVGTSTSTTTGPQDCNPNVQCGTNEICIDGPDGNCVCLPGLVLCGPDCVDLRTDN